MVDTVIIPEERRTPRLQSQLAGLKRFLKARLSPEEVLGLHLTIGILVLIVATWLFGSIAEDVVKGDPITTLDVRVSDGLQHHSSRPVTVALLIITNAHSSIPVAIFTTLII